MKHGTILAWMDKVAREIVDEHIGGVESEVERVAQLIADNASKTRCDEHKRALVCPNCEARRRGRKGAAATQKKFDKATRVGWARKGGRPVTRSDAQESSLNVANE